jgi:hypothetical protein
VKANDCPLVLITWQDSRQPEPEWRYLRDFEAPMVIECATVGWLLHDGDDCKVVCQSVGDLDDEDNAQASGIVTIPSRAVCRIERLVEMPIRADAATAWPSASTS